MTERLKHPLVLQGTHMANHCHTNLSEKHSVGGGCVHIRHCPHLWAFSRPNRHTAQGSTERADLSQPAKVRATWSSAPQLNPEAAY